MLEAHPLMNMHTLSVMEWIIWRDNFIAGNIAVNDVKEG